MSTRIAMVVMVAALVSAACSEDVSRLRLVLDQSPAGMMCVEEAPPDGAEPQPLFARGFPDLSDPDTWQMCLVVDFLRLRSVIGCRVRELLQACAEDGTCLPIAGTRQTFVIDTEAIAETIASSDSGEVGERILTELSSQVAGREILADAPQEPVLIRMVVVARPCAEVPDTGEVYDQCNSLMGCLYSCPLTLGEVDADILLDLDVFDSNCEQEVELCASSTGLRASRICD